MNGIIRITSAIGVICAGIILLILWIIAANDRGSKDGNKYKCHGVVYLFHDALVNKDPHHGNENSIKWLKGNWDVYPILIAFGAIIGLLWIIAGVIGLLARRKIIAFSYLGLGIFTYLVFLLLFAIIEIRFQRLDESFDYLWEKHCVVDGEWLVKHAWDSYEQFWGASFIGFVLGAYQIAGAIYLLYAAQWVSEEEEVGSPAKNLPAPKEEAPLKSQDVPLAPVPSSATKKA